MKYIFLKQKSDYIIPINLVVSPVVSLSHGLSIVGLLKVEEKLVIGDQKHFKEEIFSIITDEEDSIHNFSENCSQKLKFNPEFIN